MALVLVSGRRFSKWFIHQQHTIRSSLNILVIRSILRGRLKWKQQRTPAYSHIALEIGSEHIDTLSVALAAAHHQHHHHQHRH